MTKKELEEIRVRLKWAGDLTEAGEEKSTTKRAVCFICRDYIEEARRMGTYNFFDQKIFFHKKCHKKAVKVQAEMYREKAEELANVQNRIKAEKLDQKSFDIWPSSFYEGYYNNSTYGDLQIPVGWDFLPAGDAFITKTVRKLGPHWIQMRKVSKHVIAIGTWTLAENIEKAKKMAEETKEKRIVQRERGRKYDVKKEERYVKALAQAIIKYLDFAPEHKELAESIANAAAKRAGEKGSGRVGRTLKLTMEKKAELAANAHLRHCYTEYEKDLGDNKVTQDNFFDKELYLDIKRGAKWAAEDFLENHRAKKEEV